MTDDAFSVLADKMTNHVSTTYDMLLSLLDNKARSGSEAARTLEERGLVPELDLLKANHDVLQAARSAYDHLNAFASALRSVNQGGWAYGSLARASAEGFGRVHFLLSRESSLDMYHRYMRSKIRAVSFLANEQYKTYAPEWGVSAKEVGEAWGAQLEALGGQETYPNKSITPPMLAKAVLTLPEEDRSSSYYAMMASLSHSERPGTDWLIEGDLHDDHALVFHPPGLTVNIEQYLTPVFFAKTRVMLPLWEYFGLSSDEFSQWREECIDIATFANDIWYPDNGFSADH
jgi:hypothetical protein